MHFSLGTCRALALGMILMAGSSPVLAQQAGTVKPAPPQPQSKGTVNAAAPTQTPPAQTPPAQISPSQATPAVREPTPLEKEILAATDKLFAAFNEGKADALIDCFVPEAELVDEEGNIHQGHAELGNIAKAFFAKYPGAQTQAQLESVRQVGDLVFSDGSRVTSTKDGKSFAALRFTTIWKKTTQGYKVLSMRDFSEALPLTPHEALESVAWIIGEWVNEGSDAKVNLNYRWAEDQNFIVGDILVERDSKIVAKSFHRIAWDASQGTLRSWTFDSDGGFGESQWKPTNNGWVLQSQATLPDGTKGSAMVTMISLDEDRFQVKGSHRIVGDMAEPDYDFTVVRKPPKPTN